MVFHFSGNSHADTIRRIGARQNEPPRTALDPTSGLVSNVYWMNVF
jgi:hypothetical protein